MPEAFSGLNWVNVGPGGKFTPSGRLRTTPADIDAIFAHLAARDAPAIAVHFHGGLVSEGAGLEVARKMAPVYAATGTHPVTFVWETGLVETVTRQVTQIHSTKLFRKLLTYVVRQVAKRLGGDVGGRGLGEPPTEQEILEEMLRGDAFDRFDEGARGSAGTIGEDELIMVRDEVELETQAELEMDTELQALLASGMAETEHLKPDVLESTAAGGAKGPISTLRLAKAVAVVAVSVLRRYARGTDHGVYPTVVEELLRELYLADFGAWVWKGMKSVARDMWRPNGGVVDVNSAVGSYFLERLYHHQRMRPEFIVDLIGHSAGSIAICELLKACDEQDLPLAFRHLVFLAPACRTDVFLGTIQQPQGRFRSFRMYTMNDDLETRDRLVPGIYTRSLLYFIAGVLEDQPGAGILGLHRQLSGRWPYDAAEHAEIRQWLKESQRLVLSATGDADIGLGSDAARHGDFDDDERTCQSLRDLIAAGLPVRND